MKNPEPGRYYDLHLLDPQFRSKIEDLMKVLDTYYEKGLLPFQFKVFETYRSPARQKWLKEHIPPRTRADPWKSPHNYGLAADIVPFVNERYDWDVSSAHWDMLSQAAATVGLHNGLSWDRAHVEMNDWQSHKGQH